MSGRHECGVCWWSYDPNTGGADAAVPPGTDFAALPRGWRCPRCDAEAARFLPALDAERQPDKGAALVETFRSAARNMVGLPVYNPRLEVAVVGLRRTEAGDALAGVLVTPWCMSLVFIPDEDHGAAIGTARDRALPSGTYSFIVGRMDGLGLVEMCSLFSPMAVFADQAAALATAEAAAREAFTRAAELPPPAPSRPPTRRELLRIFTG